MPEEPDSIEVPRGSLGIDDDFWQCARWRFQELLKREDRTYKGPLTYDQQVVGLLGERAIHAHLRQAGLDATHWCNTISDVAVFVQHPDRIGPVIVDVEVKSNARPHWDDTGPMIVVEQIARIQSHSSLLAWCTTDANPDQGDVEIMGWMPTTDLEKCSTTVAYGFEQVVVRPLLRPARGLVAAVRDEAEPKPF